MQYFIQTRGVVEEEEEIHRRRVIENKHSGQDRSTTTTELQSECAYSYQRTEVGRIFNVGRVRCSQ